MDSELSDFRKYGYFVAGLYNGHRTHPAVAERTPIQALESKQAELKALSLANALSWVIPDANRSMSQPVTRHVYLLFSFPGVTKIDLQDSSSLRRDTR